MSARKSTRVTVEERRAEARKQRAPQKLATAYFRRLTAGEWSIRGAGAMYGGPNRIPMNPKLKAILDALESDGVSVLRTWDGSPAHCDSYDFSASFDDGGLSVRTGTYWYGERGGTISGNGALSRVIRLLDLKVSPQTRRAWSIASADVERSDSRSHRRHPLPCPGGRAAYEGTSRGPVDRLRVVSFSTCRGRCDARHRIRSGERARTADPSD
jgi:hypothetical protein